MRTYILHLVAKALGVLIHIEGFPYGAAKVRDPEATSGSQASRSDAILL
jgi:hypothetical protein